MELYHFGIQGMKWGVRRYQNPDGSLTAAGESRYGRKKTVKADNYSEKQRTYDRKIYGRGSEKRINKKMAAGEGIKSARHDEMIRKQRVNKAKSVGKKVAVAAGSVAVAAYLTKHGGKIVIPRGKGKPATVLNFADYARKYSSLSSLSKMSMSDLSKLDLY